MDSGLSPPKSAAADLASIDLASIDLASIDLASINADLGNIRDRWRAPE
jgi:hypothetical protein